MCPVVKGWKLLILPAAMAALSGCTHLAGIVVSGETGRSVPHAEFSVGQPGEVAATSRHYSRASGKFDFYIDSLDQDNLWVWSGRGDPSVDAVHINPSEISTRMRILLPDNSGHFR
ncbi:MAG: hypothetical protein HKL95_04050 [Phycisphaerae bacterium]|nr:hypothetical protein [Phycisphaerae bacterium]